MTETQFGRAAAITLLLLWLLAACADSRQEHTDHRAPLLNSAAHRTTSSRVGDDFLLTVILPRS